MSEEAIPNQNLTSNTASTIPVYFWGPSTENGYLSQWYYQPFNAPLSESSESTFTFLTSEQYMMYRKAILFNDTQIAHQILETKKPSEQKSLGRKVKNFDGAIWNQHKLKIVEDGNYYKFVNSKHLRKMLLDTGDREIVEASPEDRIWGIGFLAQDAEANRSMWGENLLGVALMGARTRIREQQSSST